MGIHAGSKTHIGNPFCHVKPQRGKFLPKTSKHTDTGQDIIPTPQATDNAELVLLREPFSRGNSTELLVGAMSISPAAFSTLPLAAVF